VSALLYFVAPLAVLRDIGSRLVVDQETVLGAIAAYLIAGMFFAYAYRAIGILQTTPFFGADGPGDVSQVLFFSFVTLTTTGYGDLVPATNPGQTLAIAEAVLGQLFLVTAVAKIITAWKPKRWPTAGEPE
jgi:voltage-gated potassium channel Kch